MSMQKVASKCKTYKESFNCTLKTKWIQGYLDPYNRGKQKLFVEFFLMGHDIKLHFQGNLNSDDRKWSLLNFKKQLSNFSSTTSLSIKNHNWCMPGIFLVSDLLEEDSQFLTFDTFKKLKRLR